MQTLTIQQAKQNLDIHWYLAGFTDYIHNCFMAIMHADLGSLAPTVENCRSLLQQSFTTRMPLLTATSALGLRRTQQSSPHSVMHIISVLYHT